MTNEMKKAILRVLERDPKSSYEIVEMVHDTLKRKGAVGPGLLVDIDFLLERLERVFSIP